MLNAIKIAAPRQRILIAHLHLQAQIAPGDAYASEPQRCVWDFCVSLSDLSEVEFSESGRQPINTRRAERSETQEILTMQACSFFSNPFSEFCFLTPAFFFTILLHKFVQVLDTLKIPVRCFGTRDTLKKVTCLILSYTLFLLLCHFI